MTASQDKKGCFLTKAYQGPGGTTLLLGLDIDGSNRLSVLNSNWSIREKDRQSLNFRLSNVSFPDTPCHRNGIRWEEVEFVTKFGEKFPTHFAASKFLQISRGDIAVGRLDLAGSGVAVTELRKCVDIYRRKPEPDAARNDGRPHIPLDPFAPDAGRSPTR